MNLLNLSFFSVFIIYRPFFVLWKRFCCFVELWICCVCCCYVTSCTCWLFSVSSFFSNISVPSCNHSRKTSSLFLSQIQHSDFLQMYHSELVFWFCWVHIPTSTQRGATLFIYSKCWISLASSCVYFSILNALNENSYSVIASFVRMVGSPCYVWIILLKMWFCSKYEFAPGNLSSKILTFHIQYNLLPENHQTRIVINGALVLSPYNEFSSKNLNRQIYLKSWIQLCIR